LIKILVVDDESSIRCLLSDVLSGEGFDVTEARDGQESLEKMENTTFDLVITDVNMPRLDGIAMVNQMNKSGRGEKVIFMTGNPDDQRFSDEQMSRVVSRLPKPFRIDSLLDVVCTVTNHN
jgi:CheY-like chemotaxis protein